MSQYTRVQFTCDSCGDDVTDKVRLEFGQCDFCKPCCDRLTLTEADTVASTVRDKRRKHAMAMQMQNQAEVFGSNERK